MIGFALAWVTKEFFRTHYNNELAETAVIYEDEGSFGGNLNRPDFKKMMKAIRDKQFKGIIVYRRDCIRFNISALSGSIEELAWLDVASVHQGAVRCRHAHRPRDDVHCFGVLANGEGNHR